MSKNAASSKTVWINFLTGFVILFPLVAPTLGFDFKLTADQISVIAGILCSANIWLRGITSEAIHFFKGK